MDKNGRLRGDTMKVATRAHARVLVRELPTLIPYMDHHALPQGFKLFGDVLVCANFRSDGFGRVKENRNCLVEKGIDYNMEKQKIEKSLLEE